MYVADARRSGALSDSREAVSRIVPAPHFRPAGLTQGIRQTQVSRCEAKEEVRAGTVAWFVTNSILISSEPQRLELRMNQ
jgi:hypothetical protein